MKLIVVGGGGREHTIIRSLKKNPQVETIYALPGNGGMAEDAVCTGISATDLDAIVAFAKDNGISVAVATSSTRERAEKNLKRLGLWDYFDAVVTGDMVERSKPEPDIFLEAAKRIGARKDECIVCEDSYNGLLAAKASGMRPIFIPDILAPNEETDKIAYKTCRDLLEVIDLIKEENKK